MQLQSNLVLIKQQQVVIYYALGVLLNVMLTGMKPNEMQISNESLSLIVKNCTSMEQSLRYQDVMQLDYDLRRLRQPITNDFPKKPEESPKKKRYRLALTILSFLILFGVGYFSRDLINLFQSNNDTSNSDTRIENYSDSQEDETVSTESDLIGVWEHGTGDHLGRAISSLTGRYISFREDGTMSTASEKRHLFSDTYNNTNLFTFSEPNIVTIGNEVYIVLVEGNRLIIENENGARRTFQYVDYNSQEVETTEEAVANENAAEPQLPIVLEGGYGLSTSSLDDIFLYYGLILENPNENYAISSLDARLTARCSDGSILGTRDILFTKVYPNQTVVAGGQAFRVDEEPATVDFEVLIPDEWQWISTGNLDQYAPLTVENTSLIEDVVLSRITGDVINETDYLIDRAMVTVIFRDEKEEIVGGSFTFVRSLSMNSTTPFDFTVMSDIVTDNYEVFARAH